MNIDIAVKVENDSQVRTVRIGDFFTTNLCGTHVKNASEIGEIVIRNIKKDKAQHRIWH